MFLHNIIDLFIRDFSSVLAERILDILPRDFSGTIDIKGVKDCLQFFGGQELLNIDCSSNKLAIVDFFIVGIIDFLYKLIDLFLIQIKRTFGDCIVKFFKFEVTAMILI